MTMITTSINEVFPVIDIEDLIAGMKNRPAIYEAADVMTRSSPFLPDWRTAEHRSCDGHSCSPSVPVRISLGDTVLVTPADAVLPWSCGCHYGSQRRWGSKNRRKPLAAKRGRSNCARRRNRGARGRLGVLSGPMEFRVSDQRPGFDREPAGRYVIRCFCNRCEMATRSV